jgi:hypothetical protein
MRSLVFLFLLLQARSTEVPWSELSLSIEREPGYSSDQVSICRVKVVNHGSRTWPGRALQFEARAIDSGIVVERAQGRFGLSLPPRGTLETLIAFSAPYVRFEVAPAGSSSDSGAPRNRSGRGSSKRPSRRRPR